MRTLKVWLEKPSFIWILVVVAYCASFWGIVRETPLNPSEQEVYTILGSYADSSFPPKIDLVRSTPDWGHLGYYATMGRLYSVVKGSEQALRIAHLVVFLFSLLVFVWLGRIATYRNRLSPVWVSGALLLLAINPYGWFSAFFLGHTGLLLLSLFLAMYFYERESFESAAFFLCFGVLVSWHALWLAAAFAVTRMTSESSRLLRPERILALAAPFVVAILPIVAWQGVVPMGEARSWLEQFRSRMPIVRPDGFFYAAALMPIYAIFSISWGLRARSRALLIGAIVSAICIPLYFFFPIVADRIQIVRSGSEVSLGLIDHGAQQLTGPYKNLLLFVPWLGGIFLFVQLLLMDVLDRSRWMRYFIVFFLFGQMVSVAMGDAQFYIVAPVMFLFTLSEALVGEEGKLA